ncbi:hypothetical protein [Aliikangiella sp. IMCC44359]|uniref:hypothetical protein n=1 Tax=Aliikangiella sp. IMCC44359 TaxID=3459125 RepID=UPI00403AC5D9
MKKYHTNLLTFLCLSLFTLLYISSSEAAPNKKDKIKLETLKIQANKELPKVLFVVPWQDKKKKKGSKEEQRLVLHSLYGDLFDPVNSTEFVEKK